MPQVRVYELAKEMQVESRVVLQELERIGCPARSAATLVPDAVVQRLRKQWQESPTAAAHTVMAPQLSRVPHRPPQRNRRELYRGTPPTGLTKAILDDYVIHRRPRGYWSDKRSDPPGAKYWQDEVDQARELGNAWAVCVLDMTEDLLIRWIEAGVTPQQARELHCKGVAPNEVGWNYEDGQLGTLASRLRRRSMTSDELALEVEARRSRD